MPDVAFYSLGCKLNQYEVQALREGFLGHGYREVPFDGPADYYVVNSCTVTADADRTTLALVRSAHRANPRAEILVTGCLATADADQLQGLPGVTHVVDNRRKNGILYRITGLPETAEDESPFFESGISYFEDKTRAFVKIQDGCDYFCSFCKIPYVRGRLASRDPRRILEELDRLDAHGYREIVLSGVCLGSYGRDLGEGWSLARLIEEALSRPGSYRIRLSSIDPRDTPLELARIMVATSRLCPHLHLSLQSGDDDTLRRMRRGYTTADYARLVEDLRRIVPDIGLSTDVIVGFPGESDEAHRRSEAFVAGTGFHRVHVFPYSERERTAASRMQGALPVEVVQDRLMRMDRAARRTAASAVETWIGRTVTVLVESRALNAGCAEGFSEHYARCVLEDAEEGLRGRLVRMKVDARDGLRLRGRGV